jgi:hypothetical protein
VALAHALPGQQITLKNNPHPHPGSLDTHVGAVKIKNKVFIPAANLMPRQPVAPVNQRAIGMNQIAGQQIFNGLNVAAG